MSINFVSICLCIFAGVGVCGNSLTIYVFSARKKTTRRTNNVSYFCLTSLAFVDLIVCAIFMPLTVYIVRNHFCTFDVLCKAYVAFATWIVPLSCLLILLLAVERYLRVCRNVLNTDRILKRLLFVALAFTTTVAFANAAGYSTNVPQAFNVSNAHFTRAELMSFSDFNTSSWMYAEFGVCFASPVDGLLTLTVIKFLKHFNNYLFVVVAVLLLAIYARVIQYLLHHDIRFSRAFSGDYTPKDIRVPRSSEYRISIYSENEASDIVQAINANPVTSRYSNKQTGFHAQSNDSNQSLFLKSVKQASHSPSPRSKTRKNRTVPSLTKKMLQLRKSTVRSSQMMIALSVLFVVTFLPTFLDINACIPATFVGKYVYLLNHVFAPVCYYIFNLSYRSEVNKLLCRFTNISQPTISSNV